MKRKYNAILIGAGSIGALKPDKFDSPKTKNVLTIAHAFYKHPRINFVGIYDTDHKKSQEAAKKWNTGWACLFDSYFRMEPKGIDIMAICTPTETHYSVIQEIIKLTEGKIFYWNISKRVIMAEKPFCQHSISGKDIMSKVEIPIAINYTRRYVKKFQQLKEKIDSGNLGQVWSCVIHYDRGLQRDGSHAIDLCNFLFGKFKGGCILPGRVCEDYSKEDLTYGVHMIYEKCGHVVLLPGDGRKYSIFEVDILAEKGRFRFIDHGLEMESYPIKPERTYGPYNSMSYGVRKYKTDLNLALMNYVQNVVDYLDGNADLLCTAEDAIEQHRVYEYLMKGVRL